MIGPTNYRAKRSQLTLTLYNLRPQIRKEFITV